MLGLNLGLLRLWHKQSDALPSTRLDLIHENFVSVINMLLETDPDPRDPDHCGSVPDPDLKLRAEGTDRSIGY